MKNISFSDWELDVAQLLLQLSKLCNHHQRKKGMIEGNENDASSCAFLEEMFGEDEDGYPKRRIKRFQIVINVSTYLLFPMRNTKCTFYHSYKHSIFQFSSVFPGRCHCREWAPTLSPEKASGNASFWFLPLWHNCLAPRKAYDPTQLHGKKLCNILSRMSRTCKEIERKILKLLHGHNTRTQLRQIHAHFLRHGLDQLNHILAHFISVCGSENKMPYANRVFLQSVNPNILPFNAMVKGYSLCGPFEESLSFFSSMKRRGIWPDEYTFAPLLKACSSLYDLKLGQCIHKDVIMIGFECFCSIQIGVVELYANCGLLEDSKKVFDEMRERDSIVWNLMIRGYCRRGDVNMGLYLFRKMSERSVVSWNIMISCLAQSGRDSEALRLFHEMQDEGFKPDEATVVTVLPICARLEAVSVGQWIQSYAESTGLYGDFVSVGNALVDFYSKCGMLETARRDLKAF
ncbi:pentatricopeptide repeat-containing protein, putative [Ricinus communis]|uniref:Pentatricopeptide repeat-containing protein, putative n=1 Tax=Ricinus communis TaxID=3988 RepID=B9RFH8_RICCO|nr:pentatricopeptide repeat-containing protein, putative [Ricinus communis]